MSLWKDIIEEIKVLIGRLTGCFIPPGQVEELQGKKILHISDTPETVYPFLVRIIDSLKPDVIIHTGDLVDNVKQKGEAPAALYEEKIDKFLKELEKREWADTYIVPGNHDSREILDKKVRNIRIKDEGSVIRIGGVDIGLAHFIENLPEQTTLNLYGHNRQTASTGKKLFLNGILNINLIDIPSMKTLSIPYPWGTESHRGYRRLSLL
ncbi:MAG: metallophosphoesterase [Bacillota bacterium]